MATAASQQWLDEELTCSICLQIYSEPVTLACKHSFCRPCIEECWPEWSSDPASCPECGAGEGVQPPGQRSFRVGKGRGGYLSLERAQAGVLCSYCIRIQQAAVKTCLKCEASMCPLHLRLHTGNGVFKNHPLVDTSTDMSVWKCSEHERLLDLYCKDDKVCVCTLCTLIGKHKDHRCGSIAEGEKELRDNLQHQLKTIQHNVASIQASLRDLHTQKINTQSLITETKREVKEKYDALRKHIENEERDVFLCLDKEQSRVTIAIDTHVRKLEKEIKFFEMCLVNLTDLSQKKEKLAFIQSHIADLCSISKFAIHKCGRSSQMNCLRPKIPPPSPLISKGMVDHLLGLQESFGPLYTLQCPLWTSLAAALIMKVRRELQSCLLIILHSWLEERIMRERHFKPQQPTNVLSKGTPIKNASEPLTSPHPGPCLDKIKLDRIKNHTQKNFELVSQVKRDRDRLISLYGQRLTPDLDTAHAQFILSDNNRSLTLSPKRLSLPKNAERFDCCQQLLCAEGVKSGRSYWEVEVVGDSGVWKVGLCYRSISRRGKGTECLLGRNPKSWCLYSLVGSVLALHDDNDTKLTVGNISRVGVYVDFEAGTILFYSVCNRKLTLVHTFQEQTFTEALYPALQIGDFTTSLNLCALK
ncbi:E3 ubiquitin/ISG15 ligase TRIM25-like [Mustelus asterias]